MNGTGKNESISAETVPQERPVRYRLISPEGKPCGDYHTAQEAARTAEAFWPGVSQRDHDNGADGWDIEAVRT